MAVQNEKLRRGVSHARHVALSNARTMCTLLALSPNHEIPCPHCSTIASRPSNLRKHLTGSRGYGGHELSVALADAAIARVENGETSSTAARPVARVVRRSGPVLRAGHWSALALLEDAPPVHDTLTAYARAIGHAVYLRPTDGGLTVISLDHGAPAMVGVGGSGSGDCCIGALPPAASAVEAAARDYRAKVAGMGRSSVEERFVLSRIRRALADGLRLRDDLLFLHQEWRFPSSDKIDILAIDTASGQLVVVEAKKSEAAATRDRDKKGRTASEQAAEYVAQIALHASECSPFFMRLAAALARVYRNGESVPFDPHLPARWEVWWPDGSTIGPKETATRKPARDDDIAFVASDAPWQRELRNRQSSWREAKRLPIGQHNGRPLGSRLAMPAAEEQLWNFLTPAIGELVAREYRANLSRPRREQKLYRHPRLFEDLLSSQPLAFNLFGELAVDLDRATHVARRLWPERVASVSRVELEWSPGRWNPRYLDNGTAADVALFHTTPRGGTGVVFVETKYHEDLSGDDYEVKPRYFEVARASGAFAGERLDTLTRGPLQQLWFDHLLALATKDTDRHESALFVVAYPEINERCGEAVARYREALTPAGAATFEARTLEELVGPVGAVVGETWESEFRSRYLAPTN